MSGLEKMKKLIPILATLSTLSFLISLSGCKKADTHNTDSNFIDLTLSEGTYKDLTLNQKSQLTNKRICVVFGYDFNSAEIVSQMLSILKEKYGLHEDGGLIYPVVYPSDFKHGTKAYASDFTALLQDDSLDLQGVVILGAPENTHTALARNQDKWNQMVPYPIIALFPQDDILGLESTCDIVLDKSQTSGLSGEISSEEIEGQLIAEAPEVLVETINYMQTLDFSLQRNSKIQSHLLQMLKGRKFHHYTDPETGLQSINHFILN